MPHTREVAHSIFVIGRTLRLCSRCFRICRGQERAVGAGLETSITCFENEHTRGRSVRLTQGRQHTRGKVDLKRASGWQARHCALLGRARCEGGR